jgi:hypothetical protein
VSPNSASIHTIAKVPAVADVRVLLHALLVLHSPPQWKALKVFYSFFTVDDGVAACIFFK